MLYQVCMVFSAWLHDVASLEAVCSLCRRGSGSSTSKYIACIVHCDAVKCSACTLQVEWTHVLREFPYISAYSVRVKDEPRPPPPPLLRYRGVLCGGSWSGWGWVDLWLREVLAYKRFLSFLSAPVSLDVTVLMVFLLYLREQLQEFRFYKGLMWLMSCLGLGRITNWFWRDRNI